MNIPLSSCMRIVFRQHSQKIVLLFTVVIFGLHEISINSPLCALWLKTSHEPSFLKCTTSTAAVHSILIMATPVDIQFFQRLIQTLIISLYTHLYCLPTRELCVVIIWHHLYLHTLIFTKYLQQRFSTIAHPTWQNDRWPL